MPAHVRVADESDFFAVRRPRRHIHGTLSAVDVRDDFGRTALNGLQADVTFLVIGVRIRIYFRRETDEDDPFAVGRNMGEPVIVFVIGDLLFPVPSGFIRQICILPVRLELK